MPQLMIEFLSEEIPARMQARAQQDLVTLTTQTLTDQGLTFGDIKGYVTPRRLVVVVEELPVEQAEIKEERRGPRTDAPAAAIEGFLNSTGLSRNDCEERETPKGTFIFATIVKPAQATVAILPDLVYTILKNFPWPKSMRWGSGQFNWVRPLHSVLCLFDGSPLDLNLIVPSTTTTVGHRFMAPQPIVVKNFDAYKAVLEHGYVLVDADVRRQKILDLLNKHTSSHSLSLRQDDGLLNEVTGLVEWPHVIMGSIDDEYMALPEEVLITVMRHHQRYFAVNDSQGKLAPHFLTITNIIPHDDGKIAIRGNEWVLRARFADAAFFWAEDQKIPLEAHGKNLNRLIFHAKLGTIADKIKRVEKLALGLNALLKLNLETEEIHTTAHLLKADLTTRMVAEFPELQGQIGYRLALAQNKPAAIANAIREHYAPLGPDQNVPHAPLSIIMCLADKLDTLAGFFLIDEKPTGSKDPYALRRAALGIVRIILETQLSSFSLTDALALALVGFNASDNEKKAKLTELKTFFNDRLRVYLRDQGYRHDLVDAALLQIDNIVRLKHIVSAFQVLLSDAALLPLIQTFKRAHNILRQFEDKHPQILTPGRFIQEEEIALYQAVDKIEIPVSNLMSQALPPIADVADMLRELQPLLDAFFEKVTVNADDLQLRGNRVALLGRVHDLFMQVINFSLLEG